MTQDPFTIEIIKEALVAIGDEMFGALIRTSMSPIIYETTDFAVGATDASGNLIAQGNGVTGFLATLDTAVQSTLLHHPYADSISPGDVFITNSPYEGGGTHLSDVVILLPVFHGTRLIAWTVNKAHWTEVGGAFPGSASTQSTDIFQEGLHFRFLKLYEAGRLNKAIVEIIRANVRLPDSTIGDLHAGVAACRVGGNRLLELVDKYGLDAVLAAMRDLLDYGERMTRAALARLPQGVFEAEDVIEEDGVGGGPFTIKVKVTIAGERMIADFTGTSPQARGPINTSLAGLVTAARCAFKAVTDPVIPANGGCFRALEVICPPGTILSAQSPAPVSVYYESMIAAIEVMWRALMPHVPDRLPVGHTRSVGATFISGIHPRTGQLFVMGEPLLGGWGASADADGDNGQFCCGNGETFNIPIELAESRYGFEIDRYGFHDDPGGEGRYRGGKGVVLDYRITADEAFLTFSSTRTASRPWSAAGGREGSHNGALVLRGDGSTEAHTMVTGLRLAKGETVRLITATGGGYGPPAQRPRAAVERDLKNGFITPAQAVEVFGQRIEAMPARPDPAKVRGMAAPRQAQA
ncbi:hydantoinase B/oxoprolinase family protein [Sphingosinicella terrae]|jgi:N-methylhydantoinase B|uniref:hydantoinase B/oxoprolinase family protein n=1 Tax=Sphingosinicella terrae TaxID=2172047 RepID=UPI000E0DE04F|nr:hydantoinase B/oxoprolinase family protein [Sphingosinicella terrae]